MPSKWWSTIDAKKKEVPLFVFLNRLKTIETILKHSTAFNGYDDDDDGDYDYVGWLNKMLFEEKKLFRICAICHSI